MFDKILLFAAAGLVMGLGFVHADKASRDPTRPPFHTAVSTQAGPDQGLPTLSSVLLSDDRRLAVLDGRVMSEGEERSGVKVWKIKHDRVVVSVAGQEPVTLMLDTKRIHKELR